MKYKYILFIFLIAFIGSCKPDLDEFSPSKGSADFSRFIAVGNSLTAGFADGALYQKAQEYAFPNILAEKFKAVGGGAFKQPLLTYPNGIGVQSAPPPIGTIFMPRLILQPVTNCAGTTLRPQPIGFPTFMAPAIQQEMAVALTTSIAADGPFNNIGVPGLRSFHMVVPGFALMNPFYGRFSSGTNTLIEEIGLINPTFFSLWLGSNDVLGYAMAGGDEGGPANAITPMGYQGNIPGFAASMDMTIGALTAYGGKGAIMNVPDILLTPYFNTVPWNGLVLTTQAEVDALNQAYQPYGITFQLGQNGFVIMDNPMPRKMVAGEYVLAIIIDSLQCANPPWGSGQPIPGNYILTKAEAWNITSAIAGYNAKILDISNKTPTQIAHVDVFALINEIHTMGINMDGILFTTDGITGNLFGLDGLHLTPRGNALSAYYIIDAINGAFGAHVPQVSISAYPGVPLP